MPLRIDVVGKTDIGLVRSGNEDYLLLDPEHHVYAVCDGMGGHQAGEVASMTAATTIQRVFAHFREELNRDTDLPVGRALPMSGDVLLKSIRLANRAINNLASRDDAKSGMGTTIAAIAFENDLASVAHVGDSRVYRIDEKALTPLTHDHSWVAELERNQQMTAEEANSFIGKNVITRALGVRETVEVDYRLIRVQPGERFLLCTDGLCGFATDDEIFDVLRDSGDDLGKGVDNLIALANGRGGSDNVSVIMVRVEEVTPSELPEVEIFTLGEESEAIQAAEDSWLEKLESVASDPAGATPEASAAPRKGIVALIFILFIVAALVILFLYQSR